MTASEHRARAREALRNNWGWAILVSFVASLLGGVANSGASINVDLPASDTYDLEALPYELQAILVGVVLVAVAVILVVAAVKLILGGVTAIGYRKYLLDLIDGRPAEFATLFSWFRRLGQPVLLALLRGLVALLVLPVFLFFWEPMLMFLALIVLLCVVIYVDYGFAMSEFIMADDESCRAVDAMKRSWAMMNGRRWELFVLGLSFIGWSLLTLFTCGVGGIVLTPYVQTANASFYREICPGVQRRPFPADGDGAVPAEPVFLPQGTPEE